MKLSIVSVFALVALAPGGLLAQGRAQERAQERARPDTTIPRASRPPAGMCRIWLDNVPVAQQPAPTDCPTAVRNRPPRGRVIFGDDYVQPRRPDSAKSRVPIKGFAPGATRPVPPRRPPRP